MSLLLGYNSTDKSTIARCNGKINQQLQKAPEFCHSDAFQFSLYLEQVKSYTICLHIGRGVDAPITTNLSLPSGEGAAAIAADEGMRV
jgi:hypothetical protein